VGGYTAKVTPVKREASTRADVALMLGAIASLIMFAIVALVARPVNDDYWAVGLLASDGFWGSLSWYYTDFQGNVSSWLFILLHTQLWLDGVSPLGAAPSILVGFVVLGSAAWGSLLFLGIHFPRGWRFLALLVVGSAISWLSLASFISPNSMTAVFYMISSIVHLWPWAFALFTLGLVCRGPKAAPILIVVAGLGLLAGNLALVESVCIAGATTLMILWARRPRQGLIWWKAGAWTWSVSLVLGLAVQLVSPATWSRGGGIGSDGALATNIQAVERLLALSDRAVGPAVAQSLVGWLDIDVWARILVPVAVFGDLVLRPGLLAIFVLGALWMNRAAANWSVRGKDLDSRLGVLMAILAAGAVVYSVAGALYAYAGRHVAGLALIGTVLALALGARSASWWDRRQSALSAASVAAVVVLALLAVQQVRWGWIRAEAWDAAQPVNAESIREGRPGDLVDVPLKGGLSQSGLRDHDGSPTYQEWLLRWQR